MSNGDSDYVLYSADGNHLRLGAKSTVVNNKYDYSISIRSNGVYLSGGYVTFGQKITNTGTQGMCYLSNSGAYTNNGQMTYDLMCHAYVYVEECVVSNTSLRFGGFVSYFDATSMISGFGESVTYGIIAAGITHIVGDLTVENATYNQEITPVRVANIGDSEETTEEITEANLLTDYYQFALVIDNIPKEYYEYELMARAYICVDGTYYYFQPTRYSVKTIAQAYLDAADTSAYTEHLDVLVYLAA